MAATAVVSQPVVAAMAKDECRGKADRLAATAQTQPVELPERREGREREREKQLGATARRHFGRRARAQLRTMLPLLLADTGSHCARILAKREITSYDALEELCLGTLLHIETVA